VLSRIRGVEAYSNTARSFNETQRLALNALDGGCTFPNCPAQAGWCEVHHTLDYTLGGPTDPDHGVPLCGYEHDQRIRQGWTAQRIHGRAAWTPPPWIDPDQKPRYNHLHQPWNAATVEADEERWADAELPPSRPVRP
jgi:hypothetical protein